MGLATFWATFSTSSSGHPAQQFSSENGNLQISNFGLSREKLIRTVPNTFEFGNLKFKFYPGATRF
jgi:hypothetical protein